MSLEYYLMLVFYVFLGMTHVKTWESTREETKGLNYKFWIRISSQIRTA